MTEPPPSRRVPAALAVALTVGVGGLGLAAIVGLGFSGAQPAPLALNEAGYYGLLLLAGGAVVVLLSSVLTGLSVRLPRFPLWVAGLPALALPLVGALGVQAQFHRVLDAVQALPAPARAHILAAGTAEVANLAVLAPALLAVVLVALAAAGLVRAFAAAALARRTRDGSERARAASDLVITLAWLVVTSLAVGLALRAVGSRMAFGALAWPVGAPGPSAARLVDGALLRERALGLAALASVPFAVGALVLALGGGRAARRVLGLGALAAALPLASLALVGVAEERTERAALRAWTEAGPAAALPSVPLGPGVSDCLHAPALRLGKTTLKTADGREFPASELDTEAGCHRVAAAFSPPSGPGDPPPVPVVAVEQGTPFARVACLAEAAAALPRPSGVPFARFAAVAWQVVLAPRGEALPVEPFAELPALPLCVQLPAFQRPAIPAPRTPLLDQAVAGEAAPEAAPGSPTAPGEAARFGLIGLLAATETAPPFVPTAPRVNVGAERWRWLPLVHSGDARDLTGDPAARAAALRAVSATASEVVLSADPDCPIDEVLRAAAVLAERDTRTTVLWSRLPPEAAPALSATFGATALPDVSASAAAAAPGSGAPAMTGRLAPDLIRAVVRAERAKLQRCYADGLTRNPKLAGKVVPRFVIGTRGDVLTVDDAGSDLPDPLVIACIQRIFAGLGFPKPEGGLVAVEYPLTFQPE